MKRFHLALGVADVEASADDYSQRLGCRPDLLIPGKYALCCGVRMRSTFDPERGPRRGWGSPGAWVGQYGQEWRCYPAVITGMESSAD